jgi:aspartate/methionine/tyrosine aminotransferase
MNTMLQPGDHVIVHYPCYQSLCDVAQSIGCQVTKWITGEADGWELDLEFLKDNLRSNTKAVIINCPHNPTGYLMTKDKQAAINDLATDHGFILCSDEVYRFLEYRDEDRLPAMCDLNDQAVSLGVMSKSFGLAGLRIGWIATKNEAVYQRMASFKDYTTICNSAPSEFLATLALRNKERLLNRNRQIIARNLEVLNRFFARYQDRFHWQPPKAGPIAFPSLANGADAETFCHELVTKAGVLLLPGPAFDDSYPRNFRIGFGRKNLPECLEKFEEFLEKQG